VTVFAVADSVAFDKKMAKTSATTIAELIPSSMTALSKLSRGFSAPRVIDAPTVKM
jgi:hypothetical protein